MVKTIMLFLHVIGAVGMGVYAIMPFLVGQFRKLSGAAQEGLASGLYVGGRVGQFSLIVLLLTGGYLISNMGPDYAISWSITVLVIFLAIGAFTGIAQKPLKAIAAAAKEGKDASAYIGRVRTFSILIVILFIAILWIMQDPWYK